ncbi:UNVERIFIED_CONTAM: hypothetical protein Sindi_2915100 [Sesamum indicum]
MPICIVCAECLPVRNGKPSGACFDCDLLKHGQHKPRPSKGWSVADRCGCRRDSTVGGCLSPLVACDAEISSLWWAKCRQSRFWVRLLVARLPANMEASRAAGDGLHPRPSAPGGTHTGRVWSSSSSVARDPEISSTWLAKCRQSRHARLPHGSWGMLLGALASSPSPAKVEASHRQVGPGPLGFCSSVPNSCFVPESSVPTGACLGVLAAVRLPRRSNASWDGGRWLVCSGHCVRNGRVSGDWRVWACWIPARQRQHPRKPLQSSAQARSCLGRGRFPVLHTHRRRHSIVPNVPFSPCAAPLGAAARGGPQGARCVPRPAHGRTCPGRWPIASSPDLSDAEHTGGYEASASVCPESKRSALRANDARHRFGLVPCGRRGRYSLFDGTCYSDNRSNSRANTCNKPRLLEGMHLLDKRIRVRFRRGSLRNGYHIQGRQQARKLPNPDTGRIHWRASLVPAAAVIPAPIAWTLGWAGRSASGVHRSSRPFCRRCAPGLNWPGRASGAVTLKKLECSKQAYALYTLAWDNIIGFRSLLRWAFGIGVMINRDSRGHSYFIVRGEILGFMKDEQLRKHLPRMFSLIKNESWGLEDDQIPS